MPKRTLMISLALTLGTACSSSPDEAAPVSNPDAGTQFQDMGSVVPVDMPPSSREEMSARPDASGLADISSLEDMRQALPKTSLVRFYQDAVAWQPAQGELVLGKDTVTQVDGVQVRSLQFGVIGGGFPRGGDKFGVNAVMHMVVDADGKLVSDAGKVALSLNREKEGEPGFGGKGVQCAIKTGHVCVTALGGNLLAPGGFPQPYPNEFDQGKPITDSTVLQLNLIAEQARGTDALGQPYMEPAIEREYVAHITRAGMYMITATQNVLLGQKLVAQKPEVFVVSGHSKWGGAAGQLIAFDPRVKGGFVSGWPLDWERWLVLAQQRWVEELGIEMFEAICGETPCAWASTKEFLAFFQSPQGRVWLAQFDTKSLIRAGYHEGKQVLALRNNNEAHPVDTESELLAQPGSLDGFVFLTNTPHTFNTEAHAAVWRHWVRHVLDDAPSLSLENTTTMKMLDADTVEVSIEAPSHPNLALELLTRESTTKTWGGLDALPAFKSKYGTSSPWKRQQMVLDSSGKATMTVSLSKGQGTALMVEASFDDGSGDTVRMTTSPRVFNAK